MELHDRELRFKPAQRRLLLKTKPKKISKQHVPTKEDIYRMVDSIPKKDEVQQTRARAIILSLWQSGVRGSCLCSWKYGMFREKLWPDVEVPLPIKVVSNRPKGVNDVAQDTKLSGYKVEYYYTFLHKEAVLALKAYLEARKKRGWIPKDSDYLFVTSGTISRGKRINSKHLNALFKTACSQIGIDPESVWTHVLRKSFRKTLYKGGVDIDIAEALMGHKLAGSRTSYFDYADLDFIKEQYLSANWDRFPIKQLEETVAKLEENGKNKDEQIKELQKQIDYKSPEYVKSLLQGMISRGKPLEVKPVRKPQIRKIRHDAIDKFIKLRKEGFNIERENSEWIVMIKEED